MAGLALVVPPEVQKASALRAEADALERQARAKDSRSGEVQPEAFWVGAEGDESETPFFVRKWIDSEVIGEFVLYFAFDLSGLCYPRRPSPCVFWWRSRGLLGLGVR